MSDLEPTLHPSNTDFTWKDRTGPFRMLISETGVVVFSSLTPHLTGPNTTDSVRKAYILQYAPSDAVAFRGDPAVGPPMRRDACDDTGRQYEVLRGGHLRGGNFGVVHFAHNLVSNCAKVRIIEPMRTRGNR